MSQVRYYEILPDSCWPREQRRWTIRTKAKLPNGEWWDVWAYCRCKPALPPPHPFLIGEMGPKSEWNEATFAAIVVSRGLADVIARVAPGDIQRIPAEIEGDDDEWEILNILSEVECVDHKQSKLTYFDQDDRNPALRGKISGIIKLVIDPERVQGQQIFRLADFNMVILVSDALRDAIERAETVGVLFVPVPYDIRYLT